MGSCKCGCGEAINSRKVFVNKEHQLRWMSTGGAAELNAMQPLEAKVRGGATSGKRSVENGHLLAASRKGGQRSRAIAKQFREKKTNDK